MSLSFVSSSDSNEIYELKVEAGGCRYQISVNDKLVLDGKSYQFIEKSIKINDQLTDKDLQFIDIHMFRISREMSLKGSKAFVNIKLQKIINDSTVLLNELKLPTFKYDEDEQQPQSISGSIEFKLQ